MSQRCNLNGEKGSPIPSAVIDLTEVDNSSAEDSFMVISSFEAVSADSGPFCDLHNPPAERKKDEEYSVIEECQVLETSEVYDGGTQSHTGK